MKVEDTWHGLLGTLRDDGAWRSVFVLGGSDTGKSTLCRFLGEALAEDAATARVDCDPGQSAIGPPTTLGAAREPGLDPVLGVRFTGATSPARHFLQTLTGIARLARKAREEGVEKLVLDSSGFMDTGAGREYHHQVLDLLAPDHLVVLQRQRELEGWLRAFEGRERPRIHRLGVSEAVEPREREERRRYRARRFRSYFEEASSRAVELDGIGCHGMVPDPLGEAPPGLLVAPLDRRGFALAVAVLEAADPDRRRLELRSPGFDPGEMASIQFGSIRIDPDSGSERV